LPVDLDPRELPARDQLEQRVLVEVQVDRQLAQRE
jgi:hypothetical protein